MGNPTPIWILERDRMFPNRKTNAELFEELVIMKEEYYDMEPTKLILTDVDGVLLNWAAGFDAWMLDKGFCHVPGNEHAYLMNERFIDVEYDQGKQLIREFNESEAVGNLVPFRDAVEGVHKLAKAGYKFGVISSHSDVPHACAQREHNLKEHFGDVFEFFVHLPTGADKDDALEPYRDSGLWWIEDKTENAIAGAVRGLRALLMDHEHNNTDKPGRDTIRVFDWNSIVTLVLKD